MYGFVHQLLEEETKNIFFDVASQYGELSLYDAGFQVKVIEDFPGLRGIPGSDRSSDLLLVSDLSSPMQHTKLSSSYSSLFPEIKDRPLLSMAVLLEDRRPYLETINDMQPHFTDDYSSPTSTPASSSSYSIPLENVSHVVSYTPSTNTTHALRILRDGLPYRKLTPDETDGDADPTGLAKAATLALKSLNVSDFDSFSLFRDDVIFLDDYDMGSPIGYEDRLIIKDNSTNFYFTPLCQDYINVLPQKMGRSPGNFTFGVVLQERHPSPTTIMDYTQHLINNFSSLSGFSPIGNVTYEVTVYNPDTSEVNTSHIPTCLMMSKNE
jgi:hypothetical protein